VKYLTSAGLIVLSILGFGKNYESCVLRKKKDGRRMERFIYMAKGANEEIL
jgi:hypothetical protein